MRRAFAWMLLAAASLGSWAAAVEATDDIARRALPALRVFDDRDGLPQNTAKATTLDRDGFLWVGTQDGAAFYDGRQWKVVNLPTRKVTNWVLAIHSCADGALLFGTNGGGLCRLKDGVWTVFDPTTSPLRDGYVESIAEVRGAAGPEYVLGTGAGLAVLAGDVVRAFDGPAGAPDDEVFSVLAPEGRADELWTASERGISHLARGRWETFTRLSGLPGDAYALALGADENGARAVWAGTWSGLARYAGGQWETVDAPDGPGTASVFCILETRDDAGATLWVGTNAGLFRRASGAWTKYSTATGLPDNSVLCLLELGRERGARGLLVGTLSGGLARIGSSMWSAFDARNGLPDEHVYSFLQTGEGDGRAMWIGTYAGLARLERGAWTVFTTASGLPNDKVNCLLETRAENGGPVVWAGTFGGLARYANGAWRTIDSRSGLPNDTVRCLVAAPGLDGRDVLWVGTYGGVARTDGETWTVTDKPNGLEDNQVASLARTVGRDGSETIWVGTLGGGLSRFAGGRWQTFRTSSGLPNDFVRAIREVARPDGGRELWVGTLAGVAVCDLDAPTPAWTVLSEESTPALPNNVVYDVRADARGRVYLMTNKGVARLTRRAPTADDPAPYSLYAFTTDDGLPSNECNGAASMVDAEGRVWVGTTAGAAVFDPSAERSPAAPAPLLVERTLVNGQPFLPGGARDVVSPATATVTGAELAHDQADVAFEFALLSYFKEHDTAYRTQLVGLEAEPTAWTSDAKRSFSRLPDGAYAFRVWGRDASGAVTGPVEIAFSVRPSPWRTWWAYALYAAVVLGLAYGAMRARVRSFERRNRLLEAAVVQRTSELDAKNRELAVAVDRAVASERQASEANRAKSTFLASMSHELRTPLNAILGFVQLMQRNRGADDETRAYLHIVRQSGAHLLGLIDDVLSISKIEAGRIVLTTAPFALGETVSNVDAILRSRAEAKGLAFGVEVSGVLPPAVVGDEGKLRQVLVNLLGNAIKFTTDGAVTLRVAWADCRGRFEVADTGHGIATGELESLFEPFVQTESGLTSSEGTGLGLTISRSFVRLMGGDLTVESELGRGTTFRFDVELPATEALAHKAPRVVAALAPGEPAYRVLVVDDVEENRLLLRTLLEPLGFEVREARGGGEAVEVGESWQPHAILMDVRMPETDGDVATREIRRREAAAGHARVPVVALSASVFEHERQAVLDAGCDAFLPKPVDAEALLRLLGELLGARYVSEGAAGAPASAVALGDGALGGVPEALLRRLRAAVDLGAIQDAAAVVEEIRLVDAEAAASLAAHLRGYDLDAIAEAIDRALGARGAAEP